MQESPAHPVAPQPTSEGPGDLTGDWFFAASSPGFSREGDDLRGRVRLRPVSSSVYEARVEFRTNEHTRKITLRVPLGRMLAGEPTFRTRIWPFEWVWAPRSGWRLFSAADRRLFCVRGAARFMTPGGILILARHGLSKADAALLITRHHRALGLSGADLDILSLSREHTA